eukprot:TRINITY_DN4554_c1_g2_i1.p3 TRINITY_DN4554_c1_g2~~TRINITY_DN4554_c1_g2_i1.p3  ORF type:complete len:117 (-),score=21.23 TRINITY_DN4554_c1_g2_i1:348-665(-)
MLMNNEVSTAVKYEIPAVWIVLNDGYYGTVKQGADQAGIQVDHLEIPQVDFKGLANSVGARGIKIENEGDVKKGLKKALTFGEPVVVDVIIDPNEQAPVSGCVPR